jgi:hypothetical protein
MVADGERPGRVWAVLLKQLMVYAATESIGK